MSANATDLTVLCRQQSEACDCAATAGCTWGSDTLGGGRCFWLNGLGSVECFACPTQARCIADECAGRDGACDCAEEQQCRWDTTSSSCRVRGTSPDQTPCTACASQAFCNPPVIRTISPPAGSVLPLQGDQLFTIEFSNRISPCDWVEPTASLASFWCSGSSSSFALARSLTSWAANFLQIRLEQATLSVFADEDVDQECGLEIDDRVLCDADMVPFLGLRRDDGIYDVTLLDRHPPEIIAFEPENGNTALGGGVVTKIELTFSEEIFLTGSSVLYGSLDNLEASSSTSSQSFEVASPVVSIDSSDDRKLIVDITSLVSPGFVYSLALPQGTVRDSRDNEFAGLAQREYVFRTSTDAVRSSLESTDSGTSIWWIFVIAMAMLLFVVVCIGCSVRMARSAKLPGSPWKSPFTTRKEFRRDVVRPAPDDEEAPQNQAGAPAGRTASWRAAGAATQPQTKGQNSRQQSGSQPAGPQQGHQSQPGGQQTGPSTSGRPPTSGTSNREAHPGQPRTSAFTANAAGAAPLRGPPPADKDQSPEVRAVESKLRALMDKPLAERKKVLKELLVEYHPDKNDRPHAKEVFQHVNNCRSWFLLET